MDEYSINHYSTYSVMKASIVERFNRTLKSLMFREFSFNGTYHWIDMYIQMIYKYNKTKHRTINMAPIEVNARVQQLLPNTVFIHVKTFAPSKYRVGDYVRLSKYKNIFEKGYTPNYSTEIFRIKFIQNTNSVT